MRLTITHTTTIEHESAVTEGVMTARLGPISDDSQRCEQFSLRAEPDASIQPFSDAFGNTAHLVTVPGRHQLLELTATSQVSTLLTSPSTTAATRPEALSDSECFDYLLPSPLVPQVDELSAMAAPFRTSDPGRSFDSVRALMNTVHEHFVYERFVTNVRTTAADAVRLRRGVCQDFTHVLIGLCRANDVPARYVSGYLVASEGIPAGPAERSPSADSHAWVEAWTPTHGWRGFDPTNNTIVSLNHVKMAIGRDYSDVPPTRGTSRGAGSERLTVRIRVDRLDDA